MTAVNGALQHANNLVVLPITMWAPVQSQVRVASVATAQANISNQNINVSLHLEDAHAQWEKDVLSFVSKYMMESNHYGELSYSVSRSLRYPGRLSFTVPSG